MRFWSLATDHVGLTPGVISFIVGPRSLRSIATSNGLQTMPSIAWFPLAILFFGITEQAILFVIVFLLFVHVIVSVRWTVLLLLGRRLG